MGTVNWTDPLVPVTGSNQNGLTGLYTQALHERGQEFNPYPWVPAFEDRYNVWKDHESPNGVLILATNIPANLGLTCTDLLVSADRTSFCAGGEGCLAWQDKDLKNCTVYETSYWCTKQGQATQNFLDTHTVANERYALYDTSVLASGWGAPVPCCACGGGGFGGDRDTLPPAVADKNVMDGSMSGGSGESVF